MTQIRPLRAAARAIYDACYPSAEWAPIGFEEAERFCTVRPRQAVDAARQALCMLAGRGEQLALFTATWVIYRKGGRPVPRSLDHWTSG